MRNPSIAITNLGICALTAFSVKELDHGLPFVVGIFAILMLTAWMTDVDKK